MTWRDDLLRVTHPDGRRLIGASFRGVAFFVDEAARSGGRRIVTHEFPLRDEPAVDDLGRAARTFPMEAYVIGDEYHRQRDALLAALEDVAGPGELVHPYYGVRRAICSALSVRETKSDGGIATLSLEFAEAPAAPPVPVEVADVAAEVEASADVALAAIAVELEEELAVDGEPSFATQSLADDLTAVTEELGAELAKVVATTQALAQLDVDIQSITSQASTLARDPAELFASFATLFESLAETILTSPREFLLAVLAAYDVETQPSAEGDSDTRALERANQVVFAAAIRRAMLIEAARALPLVEYETIEDATADRDAVADRLEAQALTASDTSYASLVTLRSEVLRAVPGEAVLASILEIEQRTSIPSLLLAYRTYGAVGPWDDRVVARNQAAHPGFMAGTLKVLSRG